MPKIIEAIYEDGVFKPLEKVELKEGERVKVLIKKIEVKKYIMAKLPEDRIKELERRFEDEDIR